MNTTDRQLLDLFIATSRSRTPEQTGVISEMADKLFKAAHQHDPEAREILKTARIRYSPAYSVGMSVQVFGLLSDLGCAVLTNHTTIPFMLTDMPVVTFNNFLLAKGFPAAHTGLGQKGLTMFIPIGPKVALLFFDRDRYKVGSRHQGKPIEVSTADVEELAKAQFLYAGNILFLPQGIDEEHVRKLHSRYAKAKTKLEGTIDEVPARGLPNGEPSLFMMTTNRAKFHISLSFISMTKDSRAEDIGNGASQLRNPALARAIQERARQRRSTDNDPSGQD